MSSSQTWVNGAGHEVKVSTSVVATGTYRHSLSDIVCKFIDDTLALETADAKRIDDAL